MPLAPEDMDSTISKSRKNEAKRFADSFWFWAAVGSLVWWFTSWAWALIPGVLIVACMFFSVRATKKQVQAEKAEKVLAEINALHDKSH